MKTITDLTTAADQPCEECGQFGALEIAGRSLCPDCVALAGCGCAGHGEGEAA